MSRYLKELGLFLIIGLVYIASNLLINKVGLARSISETPVKTLIVGDSHPAKALNPGLFNSSENISQTTEPVFVSYWKIKEFLSLKKPEILIVGFAPHNLSGLNQALLEDPRFYNELYKRYYPLFSKYGSNLSVKWSRFENFKADLKQNGFFPNNGQKSWVGQFENESGVDTLSVVGPIKRHYYRNQKEYPVSDMAIAYYDSIINLGVENSIDIYFINTPLLEEYRAQIPGNYMTTFENLKSVYASKGVRVLDYGAMELPGKYFLNPDHLNLQGANYFTEFLKTQHGF
jgi:hypothetical protein